MIQQHLRLHAYLLLTSGAGAGVLAAVVATEAEAPAGSRLAGLAILVALAVAAELLPIKVPRHSSEVTLSSAFVFAILFVDGLAAAVVTIVLASLVADAWTRKGLLKACFNAGQYALSLAAAGVVLSLIGDVPRAVEPHFTAGDLGSLIASGVVFFVVNNALAGQASALAHRVPLSALLVEDVGFHALTTGMLLAFVPIVVTTADASPALIPLLAIPLAAVYRGAQQAERNDHQALHDALTGLPNRALLRQRVEQAVAMARRQERAVAVLIMDVDRFKDVNDTLGHHYGDLLLEEIGARMRSVLRNGDTVARLGGDEFAVVLGGLREAGDALLVAATIESALARPFTLERFPLDVSASIGIACFPDHGDDVERLLQRADIAMYVAKDEKRGPQCYREEDDIHSVERLRIAGELRTGLENDELELRYQPKVELRSGRLVGAEALVRWRHAELGLLTPDRFIAVAEQTGLIRPLTLKVVEMAMRQAAEWRARGLAIPISVNVSVRDLERTLPLALAEILERTGAEPSWLLLELTESTVMADPERAGHVLDALDAMGIRLAIDDFGTGYSSLRYLQRLPVSELKIDRSFVQAMAEDPSDVAIVRTTIDLGHHLGLEIVAEGIETADVRAQLTRLGCDLGQGYHFAKPVEAGELWAWAGRRSGEAAQTSSKSRSRNVASMPTASRAASPM